MVIRTFIIDDTVTWRKLAVDAAGEFDDVEIVGTASGGELALKKMHHNPPDLVFCDVYMPGIDGVETLRRLQREFPGIQVVMMSGVSTRNTASTVKALEMGAIDFVRKPDSRIPEENRKRLHNDIAAALRVVRVRLTTRTVIKRESSAIPARAVTPPAGSLKAASPAAFGVVAIGVSTGGPEALGQVIPALPSTLSVPVLLVQHMPAGFTTSLAESLARKSALRVVEAYEDMKVEKGVVYIAPGGIHMTVRNKNGKVVIGLNDSPPENSCRPSVDVLFRSLGEVYGKHGILAVVLTGMGSDGSAGVRALKRKGCFCIAQDQNSCVVYGMPRAVVDAGLADEIVELENIAGNIIRRIEQNRENV
jgi:two-component system chemotaxis response regulator CheB